MLKRYKESEIFRHILWITTVYILSQWFLLIVSGRWWDDWIYADHNWEFISEAMRQSSMPWLAYLDASLWIFPEGFYRFFVFILYYFSAILFYFVLKNIKIIDNKDSLWIVLLFITVPVNDARITWICFPYGLGLLLYFLAFFLVTLWVSYNGAKRILFRILSIIILLCAFSFLQSTMMLNILIIAYLCYSELEKQYKGRSFGYQIKGLFITIVHYLDYLVLPIIWYFGDKVLFPGYGYFGGVYYIKWSELPNIILHSFKNSLLTFVNIFGSYGRLLQSFIVIISCGLIIIAVLLILHIHNNKHNNGERQINKKRDVILFFVGIVSFFLGFFPYAVKRTTAIDNIGIEGRDSVLLGIGVALIIYYFNKIFIKYKYLNVVVIIMIVLGTIHFNYQYLEWQGSYYQQLQLQNEFKNNDDIKNNNNYLYVSSYDLIGNRFYQLNGNAWEIYGDQTRFIMNGISDINYLVGDTREKSIEQFKKAYMMNEYDCVEQKIDGLIFAKYPHLKKHTILKQKINELFDVESFDNWITNAKSIRYRSLSNEESDYIIELYKNGKLNKEVINYLFSE